VSLLRPDWGPKTEFIHKIFSDGLTNKLVGVYTKEKKTEMILVRVYGKNSELMINRQKEIRNMKILQQNGCGAKLYAIFRNGIAYQYVSGSTLTVDTIHDSNVFPAVAAACAKMHSIEDRLDKEQMSCTKEACIWTLLKKFHNLSPESFPDNPEKDAYLKRAVPFTKTQLLDEIGKMESFLRNGALQKSKIVFSHNDLMPNNIIINHGDGKNPHCGSVLFIDYEYGDWNYREFDIANHFNEFVGLPEEDTGKLNYEKYYPSKDFQLQWLQIYLSNLKNDTHGATKNTTTDKEVEDLQDLVVQFTPLTHLLWGIWSLVQSKYSDIEFDYIDYAKQRLEQYKKDSRALFF
jgi:ethanolamine kinase